MRIRYDYPSIRPDTIEAIARYVDHGIPPGGFLTAAICNDFKEAIGRADSGNLSAIKEIATFIYMEMPSNSQGSPEKFEAWLSMHEKRRREGIENACTSDSTSA